MISLINRMNLKFYFMKKIFLLTAAILLTAGLFAQTDEVQSVPKKKEVKRIRTTESGQKVHHKSEKVQYSDISGLTDEQRNSIKQLRTEMKEGVLQNADLLREKKTHLAKLQAEEKPDQAAINTTIDEITALQGQIMKTNAEFRTKMKSVLTDEQRAEFRKFAKRQPKKGFAMACADKSSDASEIVIKKKFSEKGKNMRVIDKEGKEISDWKSIRAKGNKKINITKEKNGETEVQIETE